MRGEISMENEIEKMIREENRRNDEIFINQPFKRKLNPKNAQREDEKHRKLMKAKGYM